MELTNPEDVGFSSDRLGRLNRFMQGYVDDGKLAGIVTLLARHRRVFHFEQFGQMDIEAGRPMGLDTIFRIYSMSKPITSVALMTLHEEGAFQLDDPLGAYIPELDGLMVCSGMGEAGPALEPQERPITIRQLLSHTAGFSYGFRHDTPVDQMYRDRGVADRDTDLKAMVKQLAELPLAYQPGTQWRYSIATDVAGRLVEVLSGQTFDRYLRSTIFEPLGMNDTGFHVPEEKIYRLPTVYGPVDSEDRSQAGSGRIQPLTTPNVSSYDRPPVRFSGGGGLVSTAADYSRFCQMMVNGGVLDGVRILGPKAVELMTTSHLPEQVRSFTLSEGRSDYTQGCGFGLGFRIVQDVARNGVAGSAGAYSWGGAASTYFWVDPVEDLYAIFMTQLMPSGHYPIRAQFQTLTYQALMD